MVQSAEPTGNPWDLFPQHDHLGTDGFGNEVVVDTSHSTDGPVFGLWHDPPLVAVIAASASAFKDAAPRFVDGQDLPEWVQPAVERVAATSDLQLLSREAAEARLGDAFARWLSTLPEGAMIADLRAGEVGTGFTWDLHSQMFRHPQAAVFARYDGPKAPGLLARLFGRGG